ncbi:sensor histidine kinase [Mucilaginibacter sp.]|uniref:sensor histidine kinase n=1 Tax=Mucilaginibacter sp. TaxID=1882438 RepID=UPI00261747A5|nr:histidine kinase [Mucilaginibacter sp.]MDB4925707.1 histidine kinase [Mucilaginibacter sp.]
MKDLLKKPVTFEKIEFWAATAIYVFAIFTLLGASHLGWDHWDIPYGYLFEKYNVPFSYIKYYFIPTLCRYTTYYCAYLALTFIIVKRIANKQNIVLTIGLILCIYIIVVAVFGTTGTWLRSYLFHNKSEAYVYNLLFKQQIIDILWLLIIFGFYTLAKYVFIILTENFEARFGGLTQVTKDAGVALGIWILSVFFFLLNYIHWSYTTIWSEVILFAICLYWYASHILIPKIIAEKGELGTFLARVLVLLFISIFPVAILMFVIFHRVQAPVIVNLINIGVSLFIISPLSWFLYQHRQNKSAELVGLKTALGRSSANLDFLRSQINPHFLFNALNTLYATSIQEKADRTGEGIQKLGDMMRFMLQENVQEHISLMREVDYLNNYIDLQKLRTQTSPDIVINTEIEESINGLQIAPMLLIPFVENAFKHGISLREPSHIKITLQTRGTQLLFDVYNSIHPKLDNDPEKNKSGIGLANVKQRLQLLYPQRHELVIRENAKEFFIHLTVNL